MPVVGSTPPTLIVRHESVGMDTKLQISVRKFDSSTALMSRKLKWRKRLAVRLKFILTQKLGESTFDSCLRRYGSIAQADRVSDF